MQPAHAAGDTLVVDEVTQEEADAAATPGVWRRRAITFAFLCGVWAIPGLVAGFSLGAVYTGPANMPPIGLARAIFWQMLAWMPWAIWTVVAIWMVRVVPFRRGRWVRAALLHMVACVVVTSFQLLLAVVLDRWLSPWAMDSPIGEHIRSAFVRLADWEVVTYMAVVVAGVGFDYARRYRAGQLTAERLRTQMVQAQLRALRSQLNPHFLFNALNSVISLMDRDVPAAQRMVARLGELLRLALSADESEVPLERELSLVNQYLEIERIRFGDRLRVTVNVPSDLLDILVPNLVLQPLVENAIQHGVGPRPGPGNVLVEAQRADGDLVLRVIDDGVGLQNGHARAGHGIGVGNTRARLAALYGTDATITLRDAVPAGCIAEVRLPLVHPVPA